MLRRKIDAFGHDQISIFDYKMFAVMLTIGSLSTLGLTYTLNRSCIASSQAPQTVWVDQGASHTQNKVDASPKNVSQQPQEFVFNYPDGSQKTVALPHPSREAKIREGIMFRHNAARQEI